MSQPVRQTHLEYYRQHQITPVRYDLSNLDAHFDRRYSLYAKIGLLPLTFKHANVLEVAAGTGHNSLYISQLLPAQLVLLEPNESGLTHIHQIYSDFTKPHTKPQIITKTLEEYFPNNSFDIVLCENWLGNSTHELSLLGKLAGMVAHQGVLVVTTVSPVGFVPNLLRRLLSIYLAPMHLDFSERTEILVSAFGTHLDTLTAMTRNKIDWVQDNMMNPAYFGLCLSIPTVINQLGEQFEVVGTSPVFAEDWRWFKGLYGKQRAVNEHFMQEYASKCHNFLDHRESALTGSSIENLELENVAIHLLAAITNHEDAHIAGKDSKVHLNNIIGLLDKFIALTPQRFEQALLALNELRQLIISPEQISARKIAGMKHFSSLFGRETAYISMSRITK